MTVEFENPEPSGLASMLGGLIEQNLERDPARRRLLRPSVVSITAHDAEVAVTLVLEPGHVLVREDADPSASLRVIANSSKLLELTVVPLRFGLPDPMSAAGRAILADVVARRVRIGGMISHPRGLARLTMLLSVSETRVRT